MAEAGGQDEFRQNRSCLSSTFGLYLACMICHMNVHIHIQLYLDHFFFFKIQIYILPNYEQTGPKTEIQIGG